MLMNPNAIYQMQLHLLHCLQLTQPEGKRLNDSFTIFWYSHANNVLQVSKTP